MGERAASGRRVLIEDARRDGHHLRVTWHPGNRQFVVSTWHDDVCTGATRPRPSPRRLGGPRPRLAPP